MNDDTPIMPGPEADERTAPTEPQPPAPDEAPTSEQPDEGHDRPRRLLRSSSDRVLAGVAGGLGRYFGVDPIIFRIGFALSIFFGGLGALAYLLLAVFVPTDGDPDAAQRLGGRLQGTGLLAGGRGSSHRDPRDRRAIRPGRRRGVRGRPSAGAFPVGDRDHRDRRAAGARCAFRGGARWLIPPAVALAIGGGVAAAADLDFRGGIGERTYNPTSVASIPADGYRLGVGRLVVDLRDLDWQQAARRRLSTSTRRGPGERVRPKAGLRGRHHPRRRRRERGRRRA